MSLCKLQEIVKDTEAWCAVVRGVTKSRTQFSDWTTTAAAAAAKSLQSCPTLCDPIDRSPAVSPIPGILQARTLGWVAISFSSAWKWKVKVKSFSPVQLFSTPWTAAHQAPPSMGFSRQEHWSGVPLPSPNNNNRWQTCKERCSTSYVMKELRISTMRRQCTPVRTAQTQSSDNIKCRWASGASGRISFIAGGDGKRCGYLRRQFGKFLQHKTFSYR